MPKGHARARSEGRSAQPRCVPAEVGAGGSDILGVLAPGQKKEGPPALKWQTPLPLWYLARSRLTSVWCNVPQRGCLPVGGAGHLWRRLRPAAQPLQDGGPPHRGPAAGAAPTTVGITFHAGVAAPTADWPARLASVERRCTQLADLQLSALGRGFCSGAYGISAR